ncbi:MAG TPA: hypothetical protein VIP29_00565 [Nitrososphaeraceae archaeon]|nr:hypothetical protein [Nitrososphaeraceae archaeon]
MNDNEQREREIVSAVDEKNILPYEKWIVSFSDSRKNNIKISYREFFAQGFYEAYDIVMTYAEKQNVDVRWFKEKRNCGSTFSNYKITKLESLCTYCNKKFNHEDLIPCYHAYCHSIFCSRECMNDHLLLLHRSKT